MAILRHALTKTIIQEIDTDTFTREQWIEFIKDNVSLREIQRSIKEDLFPFERLKERAIAAYQLAEEFQNKPLG